MADCCGCFKVSQVPIFIGTYPFREPHPLDVSLGLRVSPLGQTHAHNPTHFIDFEILCRMCWERKGKEFFKVVKIGSAWPVQPEKPGTGPIEPEKLVSAKNRDKTGHPPVEPVTRLTRCRVTRFLLFLSLL